MKHLKITYSIASCLFKFAYLYVLLFFVKKSQSVLIIPQSCNVGGTRTYFLYLLDYFASKKYAINILIQQDEYTDELKELESKFSLNVLFFSNELNLLEYWYPYKHSLFKYFIVDFLKQSIFLLEIQIKLKNAVNFISVSYPASLIAALLTPIRSFYVLHSMPWGEIDKGNKFFLDLILSNSRKIITVSNFAKKVIENEWKLKNTKSVCVIYNYFQPKYTLERKRINDEILILTIGTVANGKNPLLWIEIAKEIISEFPSRQIKFVWLGDGVLFDKCKGITKGLKNISFEGFSSDVDSWYQKADLYFQPSIRESHGIAIVGAMAYAIPAIVTDNGGATECVIDGLNGYSINCSNKFEVKDRLKLLINNNNQALEMGLSGYNRYCRLFTKDVWYTKMTDLL